MYGINGKIDPPKKKWPSDRAEALRHIVEKNSADIFNTSDVLAASLTEEKITNVEVKQLELALTSDTLRKLLNSGENEPTAIEINNALFSIEKCGIADDDARDILEDLLYSINVNNVLRSYSALKEYAVDRKTTKYIPPRIYKEKLKEIMGFVCAKDTEKLTAEVQEELNMYAECDIGEANYILALMYNNGIGVKKDLNITNKYAKKAASCGYPPAYAMLGDMEYYNNNFDEAYEYYTKPGAIALDEKRSGRVDNLYRAKSFANKVCVSLGFIYALFISAMLFVINNLSLSGEHPVALSVFIALMSVTMVLVLVIHYKKPLKDLRQWGVVLALLFTVYSVIALV
mgnify:FL=1